MTVLSLIFHLKLSQYVAPVGLKILCETEAGLELSVILLPEPPTSPDSYL